LNLDKIEQVNETTLRSIHSLGSVVVGLSDIIHIEEVREMFYHTRLSTCEFKGLIKEMWKDLGTIKTIKYVISYLNKIKIV